MIKNKVYITWELTSIHGQSPSAETIRIQWVAKFARAVEILTLDARGAHELHALVLAIVGHIFKDEPISANGADI